ncbi:MAG: type II toxin-antitoxin system HipA family toxin [Gammaproteobacteria bacterium]|nr:type II toxin-antitoxin system HipA family toxin [Gammaproteobacteria bacterium]MCW5582288.1 type II toxin-antitoxin system HipA family toxin [Gammaproteobacteria bacterium]
MNKNKQRQIEVHAHWKELAEPLLIGILHATPTRGKEIFSFEYSHEWLRCSHSHALDPSLQLFHGQQYAPITQDNFGVFLDSSPDRWGRFLMKRREAQLAREENRVERSLLESDYLLGVYDEHRIGALRFRTDPKGPFLDNNKERASPPWTLLRELEHASLELEKDDAEKNPNYSKWLQMLIAPGGSLGGTRPKASVIDKHNHLWIAKFPSENDEFDIGAWEMVAYKLAQRAQIIMAEAKVEKFNSRYHTFLSKRFDRNNSGERIHFSSAMTLLQRSDGDDTSKGASYLELVEFIIQQGARTAHDLEQLWRRIVFYICVSNVDDHLRNHGFILQPNGWILSPAFDINPVVNGDGLKLNISDSDNSQDLSLAQEVAEYFRIKPERADEIIHEVVNVTKDWQKEASSLGISAREQDRMARAFRKSETLL